MESGEVTLFLKHFSGDYSEVTQSLEDKTKEKQEYAMLEAAYLITVTSKEFETGANIETRSAAS